MKKRMIALLLAAVIVLALSGCGSGGGGGSSSKTLKVNIWDNNQLAGLKEIASEWSQTSGYDVEFTVVDWGSYWTIMDAGVSGGEMPDVFWMHSNSSEKYMSSGVLMNLNDYIAGENGVDMSNYLEGVTSLYTQDGNHYALPKDHDTIAVVYNKAIFDKYGVDYPTSDWTWEEYAAIAGEISEKGAADGVYGTYCNTGSVQDFWYNVVYSFGGYVISDDKKSSGFDNPNSIKAMKFIVDELLPGCPSPDSMASTGPDTMLLSGLIGMTLQGSWNVNTFYTADNASDFAWEILPYEDVNGNGKCDDGECCSIYNGLGWSIYSKTDKADAAWSFISYMASEEAQIKQAEKGITMAGYVGCSDAFARAFEGMDVSAFVDIEEEGTLIARPSSKSQTIWEDDACQALVPAWSAPETIEDVMLQMAAQMNATLANE